MPASSHQPVSAVISIRVRAEKTSHDRPPPPHRLESLLPRTPFDAHLRVLLRWAERSRDPADTASPEENVYVWWAEIRSPRRDGELPHAAEIAALQSQIDDDVETHLYLTDYRSLYVGQLGEVTADAVLEEQGEAEHAPSYCPHESGTCAAWWPTTRPA